MACVDPVARQLRADGRDVRVGLRVALVSAAPPRRQQAERLELPREVGRHAGTAAEPVEVDLADALAETGGSGPLSLGGPRRREPGAVRPAGGAPGEL